MDALVAAAGIPLPDDPLYEFTQGGPKALLDLAGKPMVQWVLDALDQAKTIENLVVVGLDEKSGLTASKPLTFMPGPGGMLENIASGILKIAERNSQDRLALIVAGDLPAITGPMIDANVNAALKTDHDIYINAIERSSMESRFPGANRTYLKLKAGQQICGGDMYIAAIHLAQGDQGLFQRLTASRKNVFKQAAVIGYDTLLLFALRRLDIPSGLIRVNKRLGINVTASICPYAEVAMDVDKPHQLEILRQDLANRASA